MDLKQVPSPSRMRRCQCLGLTLVALSAVSAASATAPDDVTLTISLSKTQSSFHVGETIPIELEFKASTAGVYQIEMRDYDRSGRTTSEVYDVSPKGRDPLETYFKDGVFMMGGLGGPRSLGPEPVVFHHDLNEWVALDKPGRYKLTVESRRVSLAADRYSPKNGRAPVRSNEITFQVIKSDPAWERRVITDAVSQIETSTTDEKSRTRAARTLRFLGTSDAIKASIHELGRIDERAQWDLMAGLFGARDQRFVGAELERNMADADVAITGNYLFALAKLEAPIQKLPPYPGKGSPEEKAWQDLALKQREAGLDADDAAYVKAASLVSKKIGRARSETVRTLVRGPARRKPGDRPYYELIPDSDLASAFLSWPVDEQWMILQSFGNRFKSPAMKSALMQLLDSQADDLSDQKYTLLRDEALGLLYQMDPKAGRVYFLADIRKPRGNWWQSSRFLVPDETLPEMDHILGSRIGDEDNRFKDTDAQMIGRYATKAILPQVRAAYKKTKVWRSSWFEDGLIAYFLRFDPSYGVAALREKSKTIWPSSFSQSIDTALKQNLWSRVEPIIIDRLNDSNMEVARDTAGVLGKHGDNKAHLALINRLRKLHSDGASKQTSFNPGNYPAFALEQAIIGALAGSPNWQLSNSEISEMETLAFVDVNKGIAAAAHWKSPVDVEIHTDFNFFSLNQKPISDSDTLIRKISRFPKGTEFSVKTFGPEDRLSPILTELDQVARRNGLVVTK
jgi:hypothetical protein